MQWLLTVALLVALFSFYGKLGISFFHDEDGTFSFKIDLSVKKL